MAERFLPARPHGPHPPPFPRKQRVSPDRPGAVQGAERRKRTLDGEDRSGSSSAGEKGIAPSGLLVRPAKPALGNFRAGRIVVACTEPALRAARRNDNVSVLLPRRAGFLLPF